MQTQTKRHRHHLEPAGHGWRRCVLCGEVLRAPQRKGPAERPHLVNGYWLSPMDYQLVRQLRGERDRAIERAKQEYDRRLAELLSGR